jgi:hypothetical protein
VAADVKFSRRPPLTSTHLNGVFILDIEQFINELTDRLSVIAPKGFRVTTGDGLIWYSTNEGDNFSSKAETQGARRSGTYIRANFGVYGPSEEDNFIGAAVQALSELQDFVSEATGEPWPGTTAQPEPHARIDRHQLYLWYGNSADPILACRPIPLILIATLREDTPRPPSRRGAAALARRQPRRPRLRLGRQQPEHYGAVHGPFA